MVERMIGVVRPALLKFAKERLGSTGNWLKNLPLVQLLINMRFNDNLLSSSFAVMFGRNPVNKTSEDIFKNVSSEDAESKMKELWKIFHEQTVPSIIENQKKIKEERSKNYKRNVTNFEKGEQVYVRKDPDNKDKNVSKFIGPYEITERNEFGNYIIKGKDGIREVPTNFLKRSNVNKDMEEINPSDDEMEEEEEFDNSEDYFPDDGIEFQQDGAMETLEKKTRSGRTIKKPDNPYH